MLVASWQDAELLAVSWMRMNGFRGAEVTRAGADGGIDVRAPGAIAQVKREARPIGRPAVQRLVGARGRNQSLDLLFFSASGYSSGAIEYAEQMGVALFTYSSAGIISPVSAAAHRIDGMASGDQRRREREFMARQKQAALDKRQRKEDLAAGARARIEAQHGRSERSLAETVRNDAEPKPAPGAKIFRRDRSAGDRSAKATARAARKMARQAKKGRASTDVESSLFDLG